jgi:hypothetical protein
MAMTYDGPQDRQWVERWLRKWAGRVRVARHNANDVFTWDVEGPPEAIAEVPERLKVWDTPWAPHVYPPARERGDRRHGRR